MYRWEFDKGSESLTVAVSGPLIVDDVDVMLRAAVDGVGLAYTTVEHAGAELASGKLLRCWRTRVPPFPGFYLYYPSRRQLPAALSALVETLRL